MKKWIILIIIAAAILAPYFLLDGENKVLNEKTRRGLPGSFVKLADGVTHYELAGPESGPVVVLIHGATIPSFMWADITPELTRAGFRVLSYDMYGRGFSDRPRTTYDADLFDNQLMQLLEALSLKGSVDLVGCSMGNIIALNFAVRHPGRTGKVALLSAFGFPQKLGFLADLLLVPVIGDYMMGVAGDKVFRSILPINFYNEPKNYEKIKEKYIDQLEYKGFKQAFLSTRRNLMSEDFTPVFEAVGKQDRPVMLIWGVKDAVVPPENSDKVKQTIPHARMHPLEDMGHDPHLEQPEVVSGLLTEFFKK